ncbi:hypothetical protein SNOG_01533 [Parastagonospora nodorum SN15]|uniref:Uncharacterized protein n=1 Tax=Phaeosphaeria nodorum (strain SN15 / ATCC MYA-4574 / FGSC 10173) TaxID=321614 RepID=Q0V381_PHANO|nr:hypothetical protein SNOG_01533 [Parastagonospora nodorum SN15]EAT91182.1 hypothetical protein SNOG_01533 [Parastagonospora nodorum SN15]
MSIYSRAPSRQAHQGNLSTLQPVIAQVVEDTVGFRYAHLPSPSSAFGQTQDRPHRK